MLITVAHAAAWRGPHRTSRRATSVKDYLVNLGVAASRIDIVSKGKESPVCMEHNESCWQQNRRGHFIITAK